MNIIKISCPLFMNFIRFIRLNPSKARHFEGSFFRRGGGQFHPLHIS